MGIKEIRMSTIAVVDVITQYLMTFGPLFGYKYFGSLFLICYL